MARLLAWGPKKCISPEPQAEVMAIRQSLPLLLIFPATPPGLIILKDFD
jgi:hypothetical protein